MKQKRYSWPTRTGKWVLNSQIAQIGFSPRPSSMSEPIEVTFWHKVVSIEGNRQIPSALGHLSNNDKPINKRVSCFKLTDWPIFDWLMAQAILDDGRQFIGLRIFFQMSNEVNIYFQNFILFL